MTSTFTRMDESTAEQWAVIGDETIRTGLAWPSSSSPCCASWRHHRRVRHRPAHPCPADRHAGRACRGRRRMVFASLVPRHRQGHQRLQPSRHRRRDDPALRARRRLPHDQAPPGLPGPALLRALRRQPDERDQYRGEPWFDLAAQFADEWDQIAFDPGSTPSRSSTSSRWCARSLPTPSSSSLTFFDQ